MDNVEKMVEVELTAAQKLAQFEKEKLTRRQALAKFGFQAGAAAVAALTADDLLRKVGQEMRKRAGDNKVAQQVASEFEKAGVAHAVVVPCAPIPDICPPTCCERCLGWYNYESAQCGKSYSTCLNAGGDPASCGANLIYCNAQASFHYSQCKGQCPGGC